jgi:hypothetical protein
MQHRQRPLGRTHASVRKTPQLTTQGQEDSVIRKRISAPSPCLSGVAMDSHGRHDHHRCPLVKPGAAGWPTSFSSKATMLQLYGVCRLLALVLWFLFPHWRVAQNAQRNEPSASETRRWYQHTQRGRKGVRACREFFAESGRGAPPIHPEIKRR